MGAFCGPINGDPATGIFTGSSSTLLWSGACAYFDALAAATASASLLPPLIESTITDASPLLYEQFGSFTRHSASFMAQPHTQSFSRSSLSAVFFFAGVSPPRSTAGKEVEFCQS